MITQEFKYLTLIISKSYQFTKKGSKISSFDIFLAVIDFICTLFAYFSIRTPKIAAQNINPIICTRNCVKKLIENCLVHLAVKSGYFWHFLATFGIENGFMITLPTFVDLNYAENMCHVRVHLMKLKITWPNMVIFHILKIC